MDPASQTILVGPALFGQRYYLPITGTNAKFQVGDNFAYSFGKHDIKFGGDVDTFRDSNDAFIGWSTGQYDFGTVDDFNNLSGSPFGFIQNLGLNNIPLIASGFAQASVPNGRWTLCPGQVADHASLHTHLWTPVGRNSQPRLPDTIPGAGNVGRHRREFAHDPDSATYARTTGPSGARA